MKKLLTHFSFLALLSLIFIGCQGADELTSPVDDLLKGSIKSVFTWGDPLPSALPGPVDLVAGQHDVVGSVTIEKVGSGLKVTYTLDDENCSVTDVHVDVTYNQANFHVNNNGNPTFGNFDSKVYGATITYDGNAATVEFTAGQLKAALGGTAPTAGQKIYIAAHSEVCCNGTGTGGSCPNIPASDVITYAENNNPDYYVNVTFTGLGVIPAWCVDAGRGFGSLPMTHYFLCSYDLGDLSCVVDYPQNLDAANWLINNRGTFTADQIQGALWALLSDDTDWQSETRWAGWEAAKDAALQNGEGFVPQCGQKVLILIFNQNPYTGTLDCNNITSQVLAIEREVPCEQTCETAMAFPYEPDNYSSLFPNHVWFRYIAFNW